MRKNCCINIVHRHTHFSGRICIIEYIQRYLCVYTLTIPSIYILFPTFFFCVSLIFEMMLRNCILHYVLNVWYTTHTHTHPTSYGKKGPLFSTFFFCIRGEFNLYNGAKAKPALAQANSTSYNSCYENQIPPFCYKYIRVEYTCGIHIPVMRISYIWLTAFKRYGWNLMLRYDHPMMHI